MKLSTFALSVCGLCVLYISYADWIDELYDTLVEDYFGYDYEEVAPFISSVASGIEEFDSIVEQFSKPAKTTIGPYLVALALVSLTAILILIRALFFGKLFTHGGKSCHLGGEKKRPGDLSEKWRRFRSTGDEVRVIWKGNDLIESSVHCSLKGESGGLRSHRITLKEEDEDIEDTSSNESRVRRMSDIRKLLESEPEMQKYADKCAGTEDFPGKAMVELRHKLESELSLAKINEPGSDSSGAEDRSPEVLEASMSSVESLPTDDRKEESDSNADPKLMNRIRLLESRLRLEELKNRNWKSRMSRAEGILQQLNKQVERIERAGPITETLTGTLKITSTVTNWMTICPPKRNLQFAMVERYMPLYPPPRYESLSEIVKREVGLFQASVFSKGIATLPKSPLMPPLPPPLPQTSLFSKFSKSK